MSSYLYELYNAQGEEYHDTYDAIMVFLENHDGKTEIDYFLETGCYLSEGIELSTWLNRPVNDILEENLELSLDSDIREIEGATYYYYRTRFTLTFLMEVENERE